jgi:hypothetical protein
MVATWDKDAQNYNIEHKAFLALSIMAHFDNQGLNLTPLERNGASGRGI